MQSLRGKVALITGASSGIGAGIAQYFAKQGTRLSLAGRKQDNLIDVAARTELPTKHILTTVGDVMKHEDRTSLMENTLKKFGQLDILINNAGICELTSLSEVSERTFDTVFNTNLKSHVFLTKLAIPHLVQTKGNILNISSTVSDMVIPNWAVYIMTKVALDAYTKVLAAELGPQGVRVNSLNPGVVDTEIWERGNFADYPETTFHTLSEMSAQKRNATSEEIAPIAAFLASDLASFITGELLYADGGLRLR